MSYDVKVVIEESQERSGIPGIKLWDCYISLDGRTMKTKFANPGFVKPSDDDALMIVGMEAGLADVYNTPELFVRVFDSLYMEPELLISTYEDMQENAKNLKYVLGSVLYSFYTNSQLESSEDGTPEPLTVH